MVLAGHGNNITRVKIRVNPSTVTCSQDTSPAEWLGGARHLSHATVRKRTDAVASSVEAPRLNGGSVDGEENSPMVAAGRPKRGCLAASLDATFGVLRHSRDKRAAIQRLRSAKGESNSEDRRKLQR